MGIAFGQQPQMGREGLETEDARGAVEEARSVHFQRLDLKHAHMFVETRAPDEVDVIAGLKQGLDLARAPAPHDAEVATMGAGHDFEDGAGFPMPPRAEDDSFVAPLHGREFHRKGGEGKGGRARGVIRPGWS